MTKYHQESIAKKKASIECWKKQPLSPEEYRLQFKMLLEQRLARESKAMDYDNC
ncbi:MAG: hypothetical protein K2K98_04115 [Muribaculaceae bacterium]|nr:hypothetical protein [Muribaculaceae bacterium]